MMIPQGHSGTRAFNLLSIKRRKRSCLAKRQISPKRYTTSLKST